MKRAIVLAAGLGSRMQPLSARLPKPLLRIQRESLLIRHLKRLEMSGHTHAVVTCSYQSQTLRMLVSQWRSQHMRVAYSHEGAHPLETAGGIRRAWLQASKSPITLANGDVWTDFPFDALGDPQDSDAHLLLAANPQHHPEGDFVLLNSGQVAAKTPGAPSLTYTGIARLDPNCFKDHPDTPRLGALLHTLVARNRVTGQACERRWFDVGSPQVFRQINAQLRGHNG